MRNDNARRWFVVLLVLFGVGRPEPAHADPFVLTDGAFSIGRALIGDEPGSAALIWLNPLPGLFESPTREHITLVTAEWSPGDYSSTLLGASAPVRPLAPGPVPLGGTFTSNKGASVFFAGNFPDQMPFLDQSIALGFSGGMFVVPSVFPPTDEEGLYILRQPFTMHGTWTVDENGGTLFHGDLLGRGEASIVLEADQATGNSIISGVNYQFEPVPEPGTFALLGVVLGGSLVADRQRRWLSRLS